MKVSYRGHEIIVKRNPSYGGDTSLSFAVFRESDQYECDAGCEWSNEPVRNMVASLKRRVDQHLDGGLQWGEF